MSLRVAKMRRRSCSLGVIELVVDRMQWCFSEMRFVVVLGQLR